MDEKEQYKALISEIIAKQAVILGPNIAVLKARKVVELVVADDGKVIDIKAKEGFDEIVKKLVDQYVALSGEIVKQALESIFSKYPAIKKS